MARYRKETTGGRFLRAERLPMVSRTLRRTSALESGDTALPASPATMPVALNETSDWDRRRLGCVAADAPAMWSRWLLRQSPFEPAANRVPDLTQRAAVANH